MIQDRPTTCRCGLPTPCDTLRLLAPPAVICLTCGDSEAGPWAFASGRVICEACLAVGLDSGPATHRPGCRCGMTAACSTHLSLDNA